MSDDIREAKRRLPLPVLMNQLSLGQHSKKRARCPFHDDGHNSFSVWQNENGWFYKCHVGCGQGDEINFLQACRKISRADATKEFLAMAGLNGHAQCNKSRQVCLFDWQVCVEALKEKHLERLADWRGLSGAFCSWLHQRSLIGLYDACVAIPINDNGTVVAAHYRLNDGSWRVFPRDVRMRAARDRRNKQGKDCSRIRVPVGCIRRLR